MTPVQPNLEPLMTPAEVCALLRIRLSTLYAWTRRGKLPHIKVGALLRFKRSDILARLEARRS
jgi:excisionase family DNA binding protein